MRGPHPGLPGRAHRSINQNVATRLNRDLHALYAPRLTICAQVHTPQYTNYGYNNAAGDAEGDARGDAGDVVTWWPCEVSSVDARSSRCVLTYDARDGFERESREATFEASGRRRALTHADEPGATFRWRREGDESEDESEDEKFEEVEEVAASQTGGLGVDKSLGEKTDSAEALGTTRRESNALQMEDIKAALEEDSDDDAERPQVKQGPDEVLPK